MTEPLFYYQSFGVPVVPLNLYIECLSSLPWLSSRCCKKTVSDLISAGSCWIISQLRSTLLQWLPVLWSTVNIGVLGTLSKRFTGRLLAVNCFRKTLHLRCLSGFSIRFWLVHHSEAMLQNTGMFEKKKKKWCKMG